MTHYAVSSGIYAVPILMRSKRKTAEGDQYEENIRLVKAESEEQALELAIAVAKRSQFEFTVRSGEKGRWEPWMVGQPFEIADKLRPGAEVYSRTYDSKDLGVWWSHWHMWSADDDGDTAS